MLQEVQSVSVVLLTNRLMPEHLSVKFQTLHIGLQQCTTDRLQKECTFIRNMKFY